VIQGRADRRFCGERCRSRARYARAKALAARVFVDDPEPSLGADLERSLMGMATPGDVRMGGDEIPPGPEGLADKGELRYSHGRLEVREPGETVWRERVEEGRHVE